MTGTIRGKITETRAVIGAQSDKIREGLETRKNAIVDRTRQIKTDLDRRRNRAVGKLRDNSLDRIYNVSEQALLTAATVVEKAGKVTHVDALEGRAERLRDRANELEDARTGLQRPAIENYDELNVKKVNAQLDGLSTYELEKLRAYEAANKNRVTVLREVDRLLDDASV